MQITHIKNEKFTEQTVNNPSELSEILRIPSSKHRVSKVGLKEPYKRLHVVEEFFDTIKHKSQISFYALNKSYYDFLRNTKGFKNFGSKRSVDFWLFKGYTEAEAKEEISKIQTQYTKQQITKGECSVRKKTYWINKGYSEEEAIKKVADVQRRDINYFINKGMTETEAEEKMAQRNIKWINSLNERIKWDNFNLKKGRTFNQLIEKHGLEKATEILNKRTTVFHGKSNIEELIYEKHLKNYGFKRHLKMLKDSSKGMFIWDYYHEELKIAIEFNGDYWHCNPKLYDGNYPHPTIKKTAHTIWEKDKRKKELAKKNGYKVFTIWESDVIEDKINEILNALEPIKK